MSNPPEGGSRRCHDAREARPPRRRCCAASPTCAASRWGRRGGDVGSIEDVYFDDLSWTVRYLVADTGTWLSGRKVLISPAAVRGLDAAGARLETALSRRQVEESPSIDTAKPVSRQHETALQSHYGYESYWGGPYRWGPYAYPYPLLQAGVLPPVTEPPYQNRVAEELAAREREGQDPHLLVDPRSWWPGPHVLVGTDWIRGVSWDDSTVEVDVTTEAVRNAPRYEPERALSREAEARLYLHHGRPGYWDRRPEAGARPAA